MSDDTTILECAEPERPSEGPVNPWDVLYYMVCKPHLAMHHLVDNRAPAVTSGLFIAAVLSIAVLFSGSSANTLLYLGMLLVWGSFLFALWVSTVALIHFWACTFTKKGTVMALFRTSSAVWVPVICLLPAALLLQSGASSAFLFVVVSFLWSVWRALVAIAVVYHVDMTKALLFLSAPLVSMIFFGGLFAAGELALLLQML